VDGLLESHVIDRVENLQPGDVIMLQNVRFYSEEVAVKGKKVEDFEHTHIVRRLAPYMDYFVNDAFAAAHRAQTTLIGFALQVPMVAGRLMEKEIVSLERFMRAEERPKMAVLGGAKVDDSLKLMENMLNSGSLDAVLTGGLVAQVFLLANGVDVGEKSVAYLRKEFEDLEDLLGRAKALLDRYSEKIVLPDDVALDREGQRVTVSVKELPPEYPIYDIGIETIVKYSNMLSDARMAFINGPMGVYEIPEFSAGTEEILRAFRNVKGLRLAGGGHTISAIRMYGLEDNFDHISVGGGSLMAFLSGERLPVIEALRRSYQKFKGSGT
jgi:phosphoglycerate kinase